MIPLLLPPRTDMPAEIARGSDRAALQAPDGSDSPASGEALAGEFVGVLLALMGAGAQALAEAAAVTPAAQSAATLPLPGQSLHSSAPAAERESGGEADSAAPAPPLMPPLMPLTDPLWMTVSPPSPQPLSSTAAPSGRAEARTDQMMPLQAGPGSPLGGRGTLSEGPPSVYGPPAGLRTGAEVLIAEDSHTLQAPSARSDMAATAPVSAPAVDASGPAGDRAPAADDASLPFRARPQPSEAPDLPTRTAARRLQPDEEGASAPLASAPEQSKIRPLAPSRPARDESAGGQRDSRDKSAETAPLRDNSPERSPDAPASVEPMRNETQEKARSVRTTLSVASVERVVSAVRTSASQGGVEVRLRLHPESLGDVHVRLRWERGALTANLEAATPAAREALEGGLGTLRNALTDQGIHVERLHVTMRLDVEARSQGQQPGRQAGVPFGPPSPPTPRMPDELDPPKAPAGRLDIRI